jgi:hypothetical protein
MYPLLSLVAKAGVETPTSKAAPASKILRITSPLVVNTINPDISLLRATTEKPFLRWRAH